MKHIAIATSILFSSLSLANSNGKAIDYDSLYSDCVKKQTALNNTAVYLCSESVSDQAKTELNRLYKKIYTKLKAKSADDADSFEQSQKSWLKYRNTHCELAGSYVGSPMYSYCPMTLNISRVYELREFTIN